MQATTTKPPSHPVPPTPGGMGLPPGATRWSTVYVDEDKRFRTARIPVPVDQYARIVAKPWECRRCDTIRWFGTNLQAEPVCEVHNLRMRPARLRDAPLLPWGDLRRMVDRPLRAVWPGIGVAAAGAGLFEADVPVVVPVMVAPALGIVAFKVARRRLLRRAAEKGHIDLQDPGSGKRHRLRIDQRSRTVGYVAAAGATWLGVAADLGLDPATAGGRVSLSLLVAAWALPAATWWRHLRDDRDRPAPPPPPQPAEEGEAPVVPSADPDEAQVLRIWSTILAAQGRTERGADGKTVVVQRPGRLAGTWLVDWHRVEGGWAATICSHPGDYTGEVFMKARGAIASAYSMKTSMITVVPDTESETRALVLAQRKPPIMDVVRWGGPESIDIHNGVAPVAMYCDGQPVMYELYRPGWGPPHNFLCGTTGAGKSEALSTLLLVDRWAHVVGPDGSKRGLVADLLIDPQQGQSYEPFVDDLAAPVATTIDEAILMVRAVKNEMLRRNQYLSKHGWRDPQTGILHRAQWIDKRGRVRYGRKYWDPLLDGPIITLNIDEAHEFLSNKEFAELVISGARMYRKVGIRIRVCTQMPLLSDLGGSMALRSMLTGGFVWVGRTADPLSGQTAFNGRLPADPRLIPEVPGMAYILNGQAKAMLARTMWEPDYYDWVRDENDEPIGYPAELPPETLTAFGPEFQGWMRARAADEPWTPDTPATSVEVAPAGRPKAAEAVLPIITAAQGPMSTDQIDSALRQRGHEFSTWTIREALKKVGAVKVDGRWVLGEDARESAQEQLVLLGES